MASKATLGKILLSALLSRSSKVGIRDLVSAVPQWCRASVSRQYTGTSPAELGKMALALLWIVSPVDLIPEVAIPVLGFADDAVVLGWLVSTVIKEVDAFLQWRQSTESAAGFGSASTGATPHKSGAVIQGEVIDS